MLLTRTDSLTDARVPALVGSDVDVPLVTGGTRRYVNLDIAASAPCLTAVKEAVDALLPWYSSVHRGAGFKSALCTAAYEGARDSVHRFVAARPDDAVIFTRNTTDALNLLGSALPDDCRVITFAGEHHANLLPWRRGRQVTHLPIPESPEHGLDALRVALTNGTSYVGRQPILVAVTGASNVTGEIWPYAEITALAHQFGARVVLDAAQLAPHRVIDIAADDIDYLALSGHKLYAPFGAGALIGRADWLSAGDPFLAGGGAVRYVGLDDVIWADLPDRQEAGSPNVVGAVALGVACATLQAVDRRALQAAEEDMLALAEARLTSIAGIDSYRMWPGHHPRIGVLSFNLASMPYAQVAAVLSAEYGIGVRHGCFCAHPLMVSLLGIDEADDQGILHGLRRGERVALPGAVRISLGLGTSRTDIAALADALERIAVHGARWTYRSSADGADCWPDPDPRPYPAQPFPLAS